MTRAPRFDLPLYVANDTRPDIELEPIRRAYLAGRKAARSGRLRRSNPYAGRLTVRTGKVAYSVLADYWELGFEHVHPPAQLELEPAVEGDL